MNDRIIKRTILVADDEQSIRELLIACLSEYAVVTASDGAEALDLIRATKPDLVVLDVMMPKMDGYTVCQKLKKDVSTGTIPIIMATGLGFELNAALSQSLGAQAYITKPFDIQTLLKTVERLLP